MEQANALLKQAKDASGFAAAATRAKLAIRSTGEFSISDGSIPGIGEFHEATQAAAMLPIPPALISHPLTLDGNAYVFEVTARSLPSDAQWNAAKAGFKQQLVKQRQAQAWESFVQDLRARAQISINSDLVSQQSSEAPM